MAGVNSAGFEIPQRFDLRSFPAPRGKRTGPVPAPAQQLTSEGGQPFTRVWSPYVRQAGDTLRTIRASPAMTGPGIILSCVVRHDPVELGFRATGWNIGYSTTPPVEQFKGSNAVLPPGQIIVEAELFNDNATSISPNFGTEDHAGGSNWVNYISGYIIDAPTFYLWLCTEGVNANAHIVAACVTVLNQVPRQSIMNYIG